MNKWIPVLALIGMACLGLGLYSIFKSPPQTVVTTESHASSTDSNDLRAVYGIYKGTVFNKRTKVAFVTREEFFAESGKTSFDGLQFDNVPSLPTGLRFVDGRLLTAEDYQRANK
jgi:hypothetical protein